MTAGDARESGTGRSGKREDRDEEPDGRRPPPDAQERDGYVGDPDAPSPGRRQPPGPARERARGPGARRRRGTGPRGGRREAPEDPRPVGGLVRRLLGELGIADKVERAAAAARWDEVVGPEIARRTGDVRVNGRTLFVEVESSSWMQELNMRRRQILRKINEGVEQGKIENIVFVQEGKRLDG